MNQRGRVPKGGSVREEFEYDPRGNLGKEQYEKMFRIPF